MAGIGLDPQDVGLLVKALTKVGEYAGGLCSYHDFGFPGSVVVGHIEQVVEDLREMQCDRTTDPMALWSCSMSVPTAESVGSWDPRKSLGYAAGAAMLTQRFRRAMTPQNRRKALVAKILYECQQDMLDDLIDAGGYSFPDTIDLFHHCLMHLADAWLDEEEFARGLAELLKPEHRALVGRLTAITSGLRSLLSEAPNGRQALPEFERANENLVIAQAASMIQKDPSVDVRKLRRITSDLSALDADIVWQERFSAHLSWIFQLTLIDLAFAEEPLSDRELDAHRRAWYYYHIVLTHLSNLVAIRKDLDAGIVNVALLSMREGEVLDLADSSDYAPRLSMQEYEDQLRRIAEFSRRGLDAAMAASGDPDLFYPFITIMIPAVMVSNSNPDAEEMLHAYLRWIAPSVRQATMMSLDCAEEATTTYHSTRYSQQTSPLRTHRFFVTFPGMCRALRTPS